MTSEYIQLKMHNFFPTYPQTFLETLVYNSFEWDFSKNQMLLRRKDHSVNLLIYTKKVQLVSIVYIRSAMFV